MAAGFEFGRVRSSAMAALVCSLALGLTLAGCGGDDEEAAQNQAPNPNPNPGGGNSAPAIAGTPSAQVMQGALFTFTPTATDANSDPLTFSVTNAPAWAQFSSASGRLQGTPAAGDVGAYANIQISVSDGTNTVTLPAFTISVVATATGSALLSWTPVSQNTDGSAVTLTGYKVYWGATSGNYTNVEDVGVNVANHLVDQLTPGTWFFAVTAVSSMGESSFSIEAQKTI